MQTQPAPFFTNDVAGVLKVLLLIVIPIVLPVIAAIWKMVQGPIQARLDNTDRSIKDVKEDLEHDINAVGTKTNKLDTDYATHRAEYRALLERVIGLEHGERSTRERLAEFKASIEHLADTSNMNRADIVGKFEEVMERVRGDVRLLEGQVIGIRSVMEDRKRIESIIREARSNA